MKPWQWSKFAPKMRQSDSLEVAFEDGTELLFLLRSVMTDVKLSHCKELFVLIPDVQIYLHIK